MDKPLYHYDFIVIGSGIAGLIFALKVEKFGKVAIITKKNRFDSNTNNAQGGIATVITDDDSVEDHLQDTLQAGAGLCHEEVARQVIKEGKDAIEELISFGVHFCKDEFGKYDLGREGGHGKRRVLHAQDLTGKEIERALLGSVQASPNIDVFEHHFAIDLMTTHKIKKDLGKKNRVVGLYALDHASQVIKTFEAPFVLLATGGAGKVYRFTSNPDIATGDGIAMAWRAGAIVGNLEFVQFHPTSLFHPHAKNFLLSEALRGEGGILKLKNGSQFMNRYHPLGSLAPRDVVAQAIDHEMKKTGDLHVLLDMTDLDKSFLTKRFPYIHEQLKNYGLDMTNQPIPVVPAAHYLCGGVKTDLKGETNIQNLFAVGEVAFTGFHGANRLASNSLLEAVVFAKHAALETSNRKQSMTFTPHPLPPWSTGRAVESDEKVVITQDWSEIRKLMWNYVGIVRRVKRLSNAQKRIKTLRVEIEEYYWNFKITADFLELRNLSLVSALIIECALRRRESRGLHFIKDYPNLTTPKDTLLDPSKLDLTFGIKN